MFLSETNTIEETKFESNVAHNMPSSNDIGFEGQDGVLTCSSSCDSEAFGGGTCSLADCSATTVFGTGQSCECYSCECSYPTAAPTGATSDPTTLPSPAPSSLPTPAPTQNPTPSPTPTTEVTVIPEGSLLLSATKPERASGSFYLMNSNKGMLQGARVDLSVCAVFVCFTFMSPLRHHRCGRTSTEFGTQRDQRDRSACNPIGAPKRIGSYISPRRIGRPPSARG